LGRGVLIAMVFPKFKGTEVVSVGGGKIEGKYEEEGE
jgi:hypothetical protein